MIQINLIPDEFRRSQKISPKILGLLLMASVLAFGSLGTTAFLFFRVLADKQNHVDILTEELGNLRPQAQYADQLAQEKTEFQKRAATITEIAESRVLWTPVGDRLSEIANHDATTGRHQVWMDSMDIDSRAESRTPGVKIKGYSAGPNIENVANFHEDLQRDEVFSQLFETFTAPKSKLEDAEEGFEPAEKIQFEFAMNLPPRTKK